MKELVIKLAIILITFAVLSCNDTDTETAEALETVIPMPNRHGLMVDSLIWKSGTVRKNETLSDILFPYGVSFSQIRKIAASSKKEFDLRKIRPDKNYTVYLAEDSTYSLRYFVYEPDNINYVVFDIADTIKIFKGQKYVERSERQVSGIINNSLYETLKAKSVSDKLALKLSEVFAWQIDFYRIHKGDSFKIIFEEQFVEGEFIGVGSIIAAHFIHRKNPYYAFYYDRNGRSEYFDEEGRSLRKTFLKAPLKFSRISSSYSKSRFHPVLKRYKPHLGTDYAAPTGTPILSVGDGIVTEASYTRNNGRYVKIKHNSVYTTQYLHMSKIGGGIKKGKFVKQGDVIGYVGSTGLATGPHVCFRFWKNGSQVNHRKEEFPSSNPIDEKNLNDYQNFIEGRKASLDAMNLESAQSQVAAGI